MANLLGACHVSAFVGLPLVGVFLALPLHIVRLLVSGWCCVVCGWLSLRLLLALRRYEEFRPGLTYFGDNVASLQMALKGKAKGSEGALARELFVLKARHNWKFVVAHLPNESNVLADGLSRISQPGLSSSPPPEVLGAAEVPVPHLSTIWTL